MRSLRYPKTRKVEQVDDYHGIPVSDPYRWLEDDCSAERAAWINVQNALTADYLSRTPFRAEVRRRLEELVVHARYYAFDQRAGYVLFRKNDGLRNQLVLWVQRGLEGTPEVLVDPNQLSQDGSIRITGAVLSKNGRYLAYGLSDGGVDWEDYFVKDMTTGRDLSDRLRWVKCSTTAWQGNGFYYSRFPEPANKDTLFSARNENHQVWYHRVGTPQAADQLVYEDRAHPFRLHLLATTEDERFAVLTILDREAGHPGNAVYLVEAGAPARPRPIVTSFDDEFRLVDNEEGRLLFLTNHRAANWRLVLIDPARPETSAWIEVIPERSDPLEAVTSAGGKLFLTYRRHGIRRINVADRMGKLERELPMPEEGLGYVVPAERNAMSVLWLFTSFTVPMTIYRYDLATGRSSIFMEPQVPFTPGDYETKQVFYPSRDGTRVPMFVVHRKGLKLNGQSPALLSGYGGFGTSAGSLFEPLLVALLERGMVFAVACLRGGGEYGEAWHHAGWRENKQNTFDDCVAAAEWLQASGYTSPDRCALHGASNGGLTVAAVLTQRPDLFKVALPAVGVMDMLRFQRFTIGSNWTAEYGSSDDPAMFPVLLAYSPLHNVRQGIHYPATLVATADHDDLIVPAHSFKFAATLQDRGGGSNPYLLRVEAGCGHGAVSLTMALDERADLYGFMLAHMPGFASDVSSHSGPTTDQGERS
jgi:prolyl oligopeptidase